MRFLFVLSFVLLSFDAYAKNANPDLSTNVLALARSATDGKSPTHDAPDGFHLQEVELRFTSNIDAYFKGAALLSVEREDGEYKIDPEETYVETISLPSVTLKMGKFYAAVGRHNELHTHAFPFIDAPITNLRLLGEEGLNEVGISAAYLLPTSWYSEIKAQGFSSENTTLFNSGIRNNLTGVFLAKNLWDLSSASTMEIDLSFARGNNSFEAVSSLYNAALTMKWRPVQESRARSVSWTTEYMQTQRSNAPTNARAGGLSSWLQWQFAQRWWIQGRGEYLGLPKMETGVERKASALLGFVPTEYSAIRLQYDRVNNDAREKPENRIALQLNVSMGAHPAHEY
jgi:hypothetical protein